MATHDCAAVREAERPEDRPIHALLQEWCRDPRWQCTCGTVYELRDGVWEYVFQLSEGSSLRRPT